MKKMLGLTILIVGIVALAGCNNGATSADDDTVRIAIAAPMTGDNAEFGLGFWHAAQLQVDAWNEAGGVLGRQIEVVQFDDGNSNEEGASVAQRIASDGRFAGVIGPFSSGVGMTVAATYQDNEIVLISPTVGHPDFTGIGDFIFRNNTTTGVEAYAMVRMIVEELDVTNVGIISILTEWGETASGFFHEQIGNTPGLDIVAHEQVLEGSNDFSPAITVLENAGAQVVIVVGMYSTVAPYAIQHRAVNPNVELVAFSNAYSHELLALGGASVEGLMFPVAFFSGSNDPAVVDYVTRFTERFGSTPSGLTTNAFDAVGVLLAAIEHAGTTDSAAVRDALFEVTHAGIIGATSFDANGETTRTFGRAIIRNGGFELVE